MIYYLADGPRHFGNDPVCVFSRRGWEFIACVDGRMCLRLPKPPKPELRGRTLWVFPAGFYHGWTSTEPCERLVFHHTVVPLELEKHVPARGYYQVDITDADCERLRALMALARQALDHPTELSALQTETVVRELSLMALREIQPDPMPHSEVDHLRVARAMAWFHDNLACGASIGGAAEKVHVSPVHLRSLFHQVLGESPRAMINRIRMEMAADLLKHTDLTLEAIAPMVGLSSGSSLSRAVKAHFGRLPGDMRKK